jgi:hypothetical protein
MNAFAVWNRRRDYRCGRQSSRGPRGGLRLEALEERCLLTASSLYSIDGTGNNLTHPLWGSVGQDLLRNAPAQYADGLNALAGADRPSARLISTTLATDATDGGLPNSRFMSDWVYAWGQFIDHDMDLTTGGTGTQAQAADIPVPANDPYFDPGNTGNQVIPFGRSEFDPGTGITTPRQQPNDITAYLDASMIYGSNATVANALRTFVGGRLKSSPGADGVVGTQDDLLPTNDQTYFPGYHETGGDGTGAFKMANDAHLVPDGQLFMAGDIRANENIELTSVHTLFLREHNRVADTVHRLYPTLSDEAIYQTARAIVIAEVQSITVNEFLPALVGASAVPAYAGYNQRVNPGIATEFSTAGFRLGHSLLAPDVQFLNPDATTQAPPVSLADSFFNPTLFAQHGADPILKYLATDNAQEIDNKIVPELQNFLFGPPGAGGFDLASLNIQRGRDHGLADYNTVRAYYGLQPVTSFAQISSVPAVQTALQQLYGTVNNIDLWVGGLAEDHVAGSSLGPLFQRIVLDQFQRLRVGDRLWFENLYCGAALTALEHTTLAGILGRNTVNNDLQANVFFYRLQISGTVFNDANGNGVRDLGEGGVAGRTVQLIDHATGEVVAQTTTAANGTYRFDNLTSGLEAGVAYDVREVLPAGVYQTTNNPATLTFTRSRVVIGIDFGNASRPRRSPSATLVAAASDAGASGGALNDQAVGALVVEVNPAP